MEIPKIEQKKKRKEKQQEDSQILNELTEGYDSDIEQQLSTGTKSNVASAGFDIPSAPPR